ncbi:beta-ketoacyl-[acyl-carrier-protein] synthase family protein [Geopsychrobacter electrodiphilus]|uniref:beta-ketoacyl-[acyl-carrier-protein] synthase family protein n=1 Tax=Geopsychrobacter electrodiphilus TaxID=225196 RepID=UPI00036C1328|nr:beta-ketoacyl-[acyl-carrier-protein] synthase family protein [Geopsychrobacter electrodiphilus]
MNQAVAISGVGCLCAAGMTLASASASMLRRERNPGPPRAFLTSHPSPYPVFEVLAALPRQGNNPELLRTTRLALSALAEALVDAGLDDADLFGLKVGVCIGTTVGSAMNNEDFYRDFRSGADPSMAPIERYLRSNPASAVARHYRLDGPCQVVVNACASGTDAIGLGASWVRSGVCDIALVGGADELCRTTYNGFASLMIADSKPCKPFDQQRRGLNLGEGAGMLVLESAASLRSRGKSPRGYLLGYGSGTDAYHLTAPHPEGRGLRQALAETLRTANVKAQQVSFINVHGTGTPDNDRVESLVLGQLFPRTPLVATKCYTGHTLGAAGAIEAVLTLASLEQQQLPGNVGLTHADPELSVYPSAEPVGVRGTLAISESLAFGGNNSALLIGLEVPR